MDSLLQPGDPFAGIAQRSPTMPLFAVDSMAGRYLVLCLFGSMANPAAQSAMAAVQRHRGLFDDQRCGLFGVSIDPVDETEARVGPTMQGIRTLWDFDERVSRQCGVVSGGPEGSGQAKSYRQTWIVLDPSLHVAAVFPFAASGADHQAVFDFLERLPPPSAYAGCEIPAPVLLLPNVFEEGVCRQLIQLYEAAGGEESGVVRNHANVIDSGFKRRKDYNVTDPALIGIVQERIRRRVLPELRKLFFMEITRMERYIVGCYAAEDGGNFGPHRDNGPGLTAHRRFAVSINLNGDFEGGAVRFPEYNMRGIKAPPGWAVVFPCAALHAVSKVTSGRRYAFLPFVYDEAGSTIRQANLARAAHEQEVAARPLQAAH